MKWTLIVFGIALGATILLPVINFAVWSVIPPLSPHDLAKAGHIVSVDGIDTYYERYGSGAPILLVPPGGSHTSTWRFNVAALSHSHEVWTLDLPGSGYSDKPATFPYAHKSYAQFLRDFMDAMGIKKTAIGGQSLGGTVAIEFALDYPERTAALVLIASGGYSRGAKLSALNPLRYSATNAILMSFSSYPFVVKRFFDYLYHDPTPFARDTALVEQICKINRTPNARPAFYWMQRGLDFDFGLPDPGRIKSVAAPTLIIWGREDRVVDVRTSDRFHVDIAGSRLVVIDDAGHMVHEEQPGPVNQAIASFLDTLAR